MGFRLEPSYSAAREAIREYPELVKMAKGIYKYLEQLSAFGQESREKGKLAAIPHAEDELSKLLVRKALFEAIWSNLTQEEQQLLATFNWCGLTRSEALDKLSSTLYCSTSTVERRYRKALIRFQETRERFGDLIDYGCITVAENLESSS